MADKVTHTSSSLVLLLFIVSGYRVGVVVDYAETKMNSRVPKLSFERLLIDFKGTIWRKKRLVVFTYQKAIILNFGVISVVDPDPYWIRIRIGSVFRSFLDPDP